MNLDITEQESALLSELLDNAEETAIESMSRADSRTFKNLLRKRLELIASLKEKIGKVGVKAA
jgi:predicted component of type VI protein secretion system